MTPALTVLAVGVGGLGLGVGLVLGALVARTLRRFIDDWKGSSNG